MTELLDRLNNEEKPAAEEEKTPGSFGELMDTESQVRRNTADMPPSDKAWFENKLKEIDSTYKGREEKIERKQAIETIGHAMASFFAAKEGSRRGIDMSSLKFQKTDWDKKLDRLLARQKEEIGAATEVFKAGEKERRMASSMAGTKRYNSAKRVFGPDRIPVLVDRVSGALVVPQADGSVKTVDPAETSVIEKDAGVTPSGKKTRINPNTGKMEELTDKGWKPMEGVVIKPAETMQALRNYSPKDAKRLDTAAKTYKSEVGLKGATNLEKMNAEILKAYEMTHENQEEIASMLKILMAKGVLGEVGNLAEHDKEGVLATESWLAKVRSFIRLGIKGDLTEKQVPILKEVLGDANKSLISLQERALERHKKAFAKDHHIDQELIINEFGHVPLKTVGAFEKELDKEKAAPVTAKSIKEMTYKEREARIKELLDKAEEK